MIVFSSRPINNKFYRPSKVAFLNSINVLLNKTYVFERLLSLLRLVANKVRKGVSGVGALCATDH